ncbi:ABC transporter with metal-binding/Fe-S-binding domain ATP-binding protein [Methanothermobacter defluvii]|uniref:ABC transporter with metal-binding/Fe-S-binding domain ATP-binding protein n=1 Tax=Methanothermobacter defluvii TaxID=49339 RepID=A0A371NG22_9EURY|nr:TIGR00289 family protein [Methanothermobacter defluvii]REE28900.1 ABC transporter with metal-binding/Fe-S-binding domain ATP-binding protein [Methanothermobacter defluvii]
MRSAVLYSGGKDSTMALYHALQESEVEFLVSVISDNPESHMYHVPNIHLTALLAEAVGIPLIESRTAGVEEEEVEDLAGTLKTLRERGVEAVYSGALYSEYQKSRIDAICRRLGLRSVAPLWHRDPLDYMEEIVDLGFRVMVTAVAAEGLDESWLGRIVDRKMIDELADLSERYGINPAFEGGEAESLVLDGPIFKKRLEILEYEKKWFFDNGFLDIKRAVLVDKD